MRVEPGSTAFTPVKRALLRYRILLSSLILVWSVVVLQQSDETYSRGLLSLSPNLRTQTQEGIHTLVPSSTMLERDHVQRKEGKNWKLWDRSSILNEHMDLKCHWTEFKPAHRPPGIPSTPMCVYPRDRDQYVSGRIIDSGRWPDCDRLTTILREEPESTNKVHVEIGAQIGSCVMQVLLTTDATVYAFEPHPVNLFYLTSTLMNLDESYRNRVHLFPIALGAETGSSKIYMHPSNAGNAQVQKSGATVRKGETKVMIERLDDILDDGIKITQMKMDAQGFECFIVDGMPQALRNTKNLVFEVEEVQVRRFKECNPAVLVNRVKQAGFEIFRMPVMFKDYHAVNDIPDFTTFEGAIDVLAKRDERA